MSTEHGHLHPDSPLRALAEAAKARCPVCEYDQPSKHFGSDHLRCPNCGHEWLPENAHDWFTPERSIVGGESCRKCGLMRGPVNESRPCAPIRDMQPEDWFR